MDRTYFEKWHRYFLMLDCPSPDLSSSIRDLVAVRRVVEGLVDALPTRARALKLPVMSWHPTEADMTPRIPENVSGCWADWSLVGIIDDILPPRDPHDGDDEDEEDGEDEDEEEEPAVIREPDE